MIRTMLAAGASALALTLAAPVAAQDETDTPLPTMSFGEWGFDPAYISQDIEPGDDFFAYANQKWLEANPLPAEFSRFGAFNLLREKSTSDVQTLVNELLKKDASTLSADEKRIVDAYNAYLDTNSIEAAGLTNIKPYLDAIDGAETPAALASLWATEPVLCLSGVGWPRSAGSRLLSRRQREGPQHPGQVSRISGVSAGRSRLCGCCRHGPEGV